MPAWVWIVIVVALIAAAVVAWMVGSRSRTSHLQDRFGPEYDRVAGDTGSKRAAESELREREARRDALDIRPLDDASRARYLEAWNDVQKQFVDDPPGAIDRAEGLVRDVMAERGYPAEDDFEARAADVSVDHPRVVENYREGRRLARESHSGDETTENLRNAMNHYRALFDELVEQREVETR